MECNAAPKKKAENVTKQQQSRRLTDGVTDAEPIALRPRIVGAAVVAAGRGGHAPLAGAARLVHEPGRGRHGQCRGHDARQEQVTPPARHLDRAGHVREQKLLVPRALLG
jgi:hypothetical protein